MKQFLSTIVILLTLIFPTVSWGSVDGKGVICGEKKEWESGDTSYPSFFIFKREKVKINLIMSEGDLIKVFEMKTSPFEITPTEIKWEWVETSKYGGVELYYSLNRKDLSFTTVNGKKSPQKSIPKKCKVFSEKELIEEVNRLINVYQSELYEIMDGLDGKGIICYEKINDYPSFYLFKNGLVQKNNFKYVNDKIITEEVERPTNYRTNTNNVKFFIDGSYQLNRKDLTMKINEGIERYFNQQKCKVYSEKELIREVNKLIEVFQSELDNSVKDNKI